MKKLALAAAAVIAFTAVSMTAYAEQGEGNNEMIVLSGGPREDGEDADEPEETLPKTWDEPIRECFFDIDEIDKSKVVITEDDGESVKKISDDKLAEALATENFRDFAAVLGNGSFTVEYDGDPVYSTDIKGEEVTFSPHYGDEEEDNDDGMPLTTFAGYINACMTEPVRNLTLISAGRWLGSDLVSVPSLSSVDGNTSLDDLKLEDGNYDFDWDADGNDVYVYVVVYEGTAYFGGFDDGGRVDQAGGEGKDKPEPTKVENYDTFAEYFRNNDKYKDYKELEFADVIKDGQAYPLEIDGTTSFSKLDLPEGIYVFTWYVDGKLVYIELTAFDDYIAMEEVDEELNPTDGGVVVIIARNNNKNTNGGTYIAFDNKEKGESYKSDNDSNKGSSDTPYTAPNPVPSVIDKPASEVTEQTTTVTVTQTAPASDNNTSYTETTVTSDQASDKDTDNSKTGSKQSSAYLIAALSLGAVVAIRRKHKA